MNPVKTIMKESRMCRITVQVFLWVLLFSLFRPHLLACTIFSLSSGSEKVYGQNLDWHTPVPGLIIVNKREAFDLQRFYFISRGLPPGPDCQGKNGLGMNRVHGIR